MTIFEIMKRNASEDDTFSEDKINAISEMTGKPPKELFEIYNEGTQPNTPDGAPSEWTREKKLKFIEENRDNGGFEAYKRLVNERK